MSWANRFPAGCPGLRDFVSGGECVAARVVGVCEKAGVCVEQSGSGVGE
ncbi:hypothetical protein ABZ770_38880 [Streptomyces sp. NPDC006654]